MTGTILPESFWMFIKNMPVKKLSILGIRGIPARHGGFETFAEKLSLESYRVLWRPFRLSQAAMV